MDGKTLNATEDSINDLSLLNPAQLKALNEGETIGHYGQRIMMLHFRENHERRGVGKGIA